MLFEPRNQFVDRLPTQLYLADGLVAHASADRPQRLLREDGKRLTPNRAEWRCRFALISGLASFDSARLMRSLNQ